MICVNALILNQCIHDDIEDSPDLPLVYLKRSSLRRLGLQRRLFLWKWFSHKPYVQVVGGLQGLTGTNTFAGEPIVRGAGY